MQKTKEHWKAKKIKNHESQVKKYRLKYRTWGLTLQRFRINLKNWDFQPLKPVGIKKY